MNGWIKLHRKFGDWGYYGNSQMVHLFIHLLINANFEDKGWNGIVIKRGQFVTGLLSIHNATGISIQSTRTLLKKLEKTKEIIVKSTNKYSIITICKYDDYQFENDDTNKQLTNNQQTTNKQLTTTKEIEEIKKERNNKIAISKLNDLDFPRIEYKPIWLTWVEHKKIQFNDTYKSEKSELIAFKNLLALSGNNYETAEKIVNRSIANSWKGLFPLDKNTQQSGQREKMYQ